MFKDIARVIGATTVAMTLGFSAPALAVTTVPLDGTVSFVSGAPGFPVLTNEPFSASFSFDETAVDIVAGTEIIGWYDSVGAAFGASISAAGYTLDLLGGIVQTDLTNSDTDIFKMLASKTVNIDGFGAFLVQLTVLLTDTTGEALASDDLVTPVLSAFGESWVQIYIKEQATGLSAIYEGTLAAVPVPAALPLLGAGLAALGFMGWRKKRAAAA